LNFSRSYINCARARHSSYIPISWLFPWMIGLSAEFPRCWPVAQLPVPDLSRRACRTFLTRLPPHPLRIKTPLPTVIAWRRTSHTDARCPSRTRASSSPTTFPNWHPTARFRWSSSIFNLRPDMVGATPMNVICRSPLGRGKTTCVRAIFSEIEALTSRFSRSMFRGGLWDPPPADHTPFVRGVCLIFSSCPGPLTTMTGSNLAGHRLLEVLVAPCSAPRSSHGGVTHGHPSNDPHRPALRASSHPIGGRAVQDDRPGRRDRQVSFRPVYGEPGSPRLRSKRADSRHAARPSAIPDTKRPK